MKNKYKNLVLEYDDLSIIEEEIDYLKEQEEYKDYTDEELFDLVANDSDIFNLHWDFILNELDFYLEEIKRDKTNPYFKVKGLNMGWRNLEGLKIVKADNSRELLNEILPQTDLSIRVYKTKTQIILKVSHHDSPLGEYYIIKSLSKKEVKEEERIF